MMTLLPVPAGWITSAPVATNAEAVAAAPAVATSRTWRRDLLLVLAVAWAARLVFILVVPTSAHSDDVNNWVAVAHQLRLGHNPYVTTTFLNWPPLWMCCIWLIDHVSRALGISFFLGLRLFLIAVESLLIVALYAFLARVAPRDARRVVLVGISLNPIAILLVCQHDNFDVIAGLFCFVGVLALTASARARDAVAWLAGSLLLGLGVLAKTTPLVLAPLLAPGARATRSWLGRGLGAALFLGPVVLGMAVIYVLAPHAVTENVIRYRSSSGWFGFTGLVEGFGPARFSKVYYSKDVFPVLALAWIVLGTVFMWRRELGERRTILLAGLVLFIVPTLGPGYRPHYAYWWLPFFVASYPLFDRGWRRALIVFYVVAGLEYVAEYALFPSLGAFLDAWFPSNGFLARAAHHSGDPKWQTEFRIPFFLACLYVLAEGLRRLRRQ